MKLFGMNLEDALNKPKGEVSFELPNVGNWWGSEEYFMDNHPTASLEFEPRVKRINSKVKKKILIYNDHMDRVQKDGFDRAPTPKEAYSLLLARCEELLNEHLNGIADDMFFNEEEFLSCAIEKEGSLISVYTNVKRLDWDGWRYNKPDSSAWYSEKMYISSGEIAPGKHPLSEIAKYCPNIISYFYGKRFDELPKRIQGAYANIPVDKEIWPISIGSGYDISFARSFAASRGVKKK